jgi:hypothetical protein
VQAAGWVDTHLGWDTLIASFIVAAVTIGYVVLTWWLVRAGRQATAAAQDANEVARQSLLADRQQYALSLRNRHDSTMPALTIRFGGTAVHRRGETPQQTLNVGTVSRQDFQSLLLVVNSSFDVVNYGPGPALLWVEATSDEEIRLSDSHDNSVDLTRDPTVLPPSSTPVTIGLSLSTDGHKVFERFIGKTYADVAFRWSGLVEQGVHDSGSFSLTAADQNLVSDPVDNAFLGRVFSQRAALVRPGPRSYPTAP